MEEKTWVEMELAAAETELRECDSLNRQHGLMLTEQDVVGLLQLRAEALRVTGRVEFGGGILPRLIRAFCDSPYVDEENYAEILGELQDAFYYFKNESQDRFSDDELIEFMRRAFNGRAEGSGEILCTVSLEELCRWARNDGNYLYEDEAQWL